VPKVAIDEYGNFGTVEYDIRLAWQPFDVQPIPLPQVRQTAAKREFSTRVATLNGAHDTGHDLRVPRLMAFHLVYPFQLSKIAASDVLNAVPAMSKRKATGTFGHLDKTARRHDGGA